MTEHKMFHELEVGDLVTYIHRHRTKSGVDRSPVLAIVTARTARTVTVGTGVNARRFTLKQAVHAALTTR